MNDNEIAYIVNASDFQVRNGHARKAEEALRASGFEKSPVSWSDEWVWIGPADSDYRGNIAHYIQRGTIVEA